VIGGSGLLFEHDFHCALGIRESKFNLAIDAFERSGVARAGTRRCCSANCQRAVGFVHGN